MAWFNVHAKYYDDGDQDFDRVEDFEIEAASEEEAGDIFHDMKPSDCWVIEHIAEMENNNG